MNSSDELAAKIIAAKKFLNDEVVRLRTNPDASFLSFREVGDRLDLIHEVERIGVRHLTEREARKVKRMITQLDAFKASSN